MTFYAHNTEEVLLDHNSFLAVMLRNVADVTHEHDAIWIWQNNRERITHDEICCLTF